LQNSGSVARDHLKNQGRGGMTTEVTFRELMCGNFNWSEMPQDRTLKFSVGMVMEF
jgi:hypothetical protein